MWTRAYNYRTWESAWSKGNTYFFFFFFQMRVQPFDVLRMSDFWRRGHVLSFRDVGPYIGNIHTKVLFKFWSNIMYTLEPYIPIYRLHHPCFQYSAISVVTTWIILNPTFSRKKCFICFLCSILPWALSFQKMLVDLHFWERSRYLVIYIIWIILLSWY